MSLNNANIGGSGKKNTIAINSVIKNEKTRKSNGDVKVGSEAQPNTVIMALVSNRPTTATSTLVFTFHISISVCCLLAPICGNKLLFFQVKLLSYMFCVEFVALFVKYFKDTQDILIYKRFLTTGDLDDN